MTASSSTSENGGFRWPNKQRSGTLHAVDRIVARMNGRVAETGTAEELLAAGGYFAKLTRENT